ncbi:histamine H3 receptor-like [Dendropsophus ebraccatus]|uniref:histamine H3 receptor-like n=1 Tax=Dendropsophus ebraccatus TaxID=150705 RepID=UPI0038319C69
MSAYHNNGSKNYVEDSVFFTSSNISNQTQTVDDVRIFQAVLMSLMISVTGTGNALVILGFVTNKKLRTASNYFILNLAISDFLTGTFSLPLYLKNFIINRGWVLGRSICKLWLTIDYTLCQCTIYNIVLISCDRFLAVTKAVKYRHEQQNLKAAFMKMAVVWIIAFLNFGPAIILWEYVVGYSVMPDNECNPEFYYSSRYSLYSSIFDFFTPMSAIAFFNLSIYFNIRGRMRNKVQNGGGNSSDSHSGKKSNDIFVVNCTEDLSHYITTSPQRNQKLETAKKKSNVKYWFLFYKTKNHKAAAKSARNEKTNGDGTLDTTKNSALAKDKKMAKSLAILVGTFCICWAPYSFLTIISEGFCDDLKPLRLAQNPANGKIHIALLLAQYQFSLLFIGFQSNST